jgi:cytochrome c5
MQAGNFSFRHSVGWIHGMFSERSASGRLRYAEVKDRIVKASARHFASPIFILFAAAALPLQALAQDAVERPGDQTVGNVCSVCHEDGLMGAPRIGDSSAWKARLGRAGSVDTLDDTAAHGKGNMPPRGGQPALTNADLRAAIRFMLSKSGALSENVSSNSPGSAISPAPAASSIHSQ